jgi:hypothetical protein
VFTADRLDGGSLGDARLSDLRSRGTHCLHHRVRLGHLEQQHITPTAIPLVAVPKATRVATLTRNLFQDQLDADRCPFCGAPGGSCNDSVLGERILNLESGATVLVESDIYEDVERDGQTARRLKWRAGEFITPEEADRTGVRQVPFIVRLDRERTALEKELNMQGSSENKSLGATAENKQALHPAENKAEVPAEDKADREKPDKGNWLIEGPDRGEKHEDKA